MAVVATGKYVKLLHRKMAMHIDTMADSFITTGCIILVGHTGKHTLSVVITWWRPVVTSCTQVKFSDHGSQPLATSTQ